MKEKKSILGNLFGKDRETRDTKRDSEIQVTYEKVEEPTIKNGEKKTTDPGKRTQLPPVCNTAEEDDYYQNLIKEATAPVKGPFVNRKNESVEGADKKVSTNTWSNERFKEKRNYTPVTIKPVIKPLVDKKLTILLVEETTDVNPYSNWILRTIGTVSDDNYLCIIRYSDIVDTTIKIKSKFTKEELLVKDNTENDKKCYYDALKKAYEIIVEYYSKIIEDSINRIRVNDIEIFGIGTSSDNCSNTSFEEALECFEKILKKDINAKYFSTKDINMMNAARFGFRSIGSMSKDY